MTHDIIQRRYDSKSEAFGSASTPQLRPRRRLGELALALVRPLVKAGRKTSWRVAIALVAVSLLGSVIPSSAVVAQNPSEDFAIAAGHYERGEWEEAAAGFTSVIRKYERTDQGSASVFFLAEVMLQQGDLTNAYRGFQSYVRRQANGPHYIRASFRQAETAFRLKNFGVALRLLEDFVRANPDDALNEYTLAYLGEIRLNRNEPQLAQRAYETSLKLFPAGKLSNDCRMGLARSLMRLGQVAEAERFFHFLKTQDDEKLASESMMQLGILSHQAGDLEAAETYLVGALDALSDSRAQAEATFWLARTYAALEDLSRAEEQFSSIDVDLLASDLATAALFDGAVIAAKLDQNETALKRLRQLRKLETSEALAAAALRMEIDLHTSLGRTDEALSLSRRFRDQFPEDGRLYSLLDADGRSHYGNSRFLDAIDSFDELIESTRNNDSITDAQRADWQYLKCLSHLGLADFDGAERALSNIELLEQSEQLKPLVQIARATARFGQQRYESAIKNYRGYLRLAPTGAETKRARRELTVCLAEVGDWPATSAAFDDFKYHHEQDPELASLAEFLADKAYRGQDFLLAAKFYQTVVANAEPGEALARALAGLAWSQTELGQHEVAQQTFERLCRECPDTRFAGDAAIARAKYLEDQGEHRNAADMYGLVIRQFDGTKIAKVATLRRAYALQKLGGAVNLEEAKILLNEYLRFTSDNPLSDEATYQLGWLLYDSGDVGEAQQHFQKLVEQYPESKYWSDAAYRVVQWAINRGDLATAKPMITRLTRRADVPDVVLERVLFMQGQLAAQESDWSEVTKSMRDLMERSGASAMRTKAEYWLAESLYRQNEFDEARDRFVRLLPAINQLDPSLEPWVRLRSAQCYARDERWGEAEELARASRDEYPDFDSVYEFDFLIARALEDAGKLSESREYYQRVIDSPRGMNSETAAIGQWRIGETFFHQEDYVEAIKAYQRVDSLFSFPHWRSAALIQAGKCQEHLSKHKHAIKLYSQLLTKFPESEFASEAKTRLMRLQRLSQRTTDADVRF